MPRKNNRISYDIVKMAENLHDKYVATHGIEVAMRVLTLASQKTIASAKRLKRKYPND